MRADTLKKWLEEQGCRFDKHAHERGEGHASLIVKLGGKEFVLPSVGTHQDLPKNEIQRILNDLGLSGADLPHGEDTETEIYKNVDLKNKGQVH